MKTLLLLVLVVSGCITPLVETPRPKFSGNFAVQVPGHPNFFYSPFALGEVWIDATGLQSGQKIKCPVTGKTLVLP